MTQAKEKPPILLIGLESVIEKHITDLLSMADIKAVPMNLEDIVNKVDPPPCLVISGPPKEGVDAAEVAQILRMQYQHIPIFICCVAKEGFERKEFVKNGFTDGFLLPMDNSNLRAAVSEVLSKATDGSVRFYRPVKMMDVDPGTILDFDTSVFLPVNKKYVKISNSGDSLNAERVEKLKAAKLSSVYVPFDQMGHFYEYSAKRLKSLNSTTTLSATEKKEKLSGAIRDLLSGMFTEQAASFESGQEMLKDCNEIVKSYILQGGESEWYSRIQQVIGERGGTYSHAGNVSTLAALFSMGTGIGTPEDLALAGLLHDIGMVELPGEIQTMPVQDMTPEQYTEYKKHPELSVNLIRKRKIVVSEKVSKIILQHHELFNGQGFPNGIFGDRILKEAQILSLADEFDELTAEKEGRIAMSPFEAIDSMKKSQVNDPSKIHYDPEILNKVLALFPAKTP